VERSDERAATYYADAALQGHASAQASLGYMYMRQRRFAEALELLRKSAEQSWYTVAYAYISRYS
jgi:TPR repeat protein